VQLIQRSCRVCPGPVGLEAGVFVFYALTRAFDCSKPLISASNPDEPADRGVPLIDRYMKKAILRLGCAAKRLREWSKNFSNVASKGLVLWGGDEPCVPKKVAHLKAHCSR
jgi:hypothetical protein